MQTPEDAAAVLGMIVRKERELKEDVISEVCTNAFKNIQEKGLMKYEDHWIKLGKLALKGNSIKLLKLKNAIYKWVSTTNLRNFIRDISLKLKRIEALATSCWILARSLRMKININFEDGIGKDGKEYKYAYASTELRLLKGSFENGIRKKSLSGFIHQYHQSLYEDLEASSNYRSFLMSYFPSRIISSITQICAPPSSNTFASEDDLTFLDDKDHMTIIIPFSF